MFAKRLAKHVRAYLEEGAATAARQRAGADVARDIGRLERARQALLEEISPPHDPSAEVLVDAVRAYLDGEVGCEPWRAGGSSAAAGPVPAELQRVRRALDGHLRAIDGAARDHAHRRRVLVAVDQSQQAQWAVQVAAQLAIDLHARLILVHVAPVEVSVVRDFEYEERLDNMHRREGEKVLDAAQRALPADVASTVVLRHGEAPEEIVAAAREWMADYLVIGTHGRRRFAQLVLGSTAEAVIRTAPCAVVTVAHDPALAEQDACAAGAASPFSITG